MSTSETGIPNQAEPSATSTNVLSPSEVRRRRVVHLIFIVALVAILAWKYYLYFQYTETEHGINARRLGASCMHLLLWLFCYGLCISGSRNPLSLILLLLLSGVTLLVGLFTLPILGCVGIGIMYVIYHVSAPASQVSPADSSSNPS
jgi:hypothetical protein